MEVSNVTISYSAELIALELREFHHCQFVHIWEVHILASSDLLYGSMGLCRLSKSWHCQSFYNAFLIRLVHSESPTIELQISRCIFYLRGDM
jgi:hypothetical protein